MSNKKKATMLAGRGALYGGYPSSGRGDSMRAGLLIVMALVLSGTALAAQFEAAKLVAADGQRSDYFGFPVSISGQTAVLGALGDDDRGHDSGSAYVFVHDGVSWVEAGKLLALDGAPEDRFGHAVAICGNTAVVGACEDDDLGPESGSAYVFQHDGFAWTQQAKLLALDGEAEDGFGFAVAIDGDTAVIGAPGDDDHGDASGAVYIFVREEGLWTQQVKLVASDSEGSEGFAQAVAISCDTVVVGAKRDEDNGYRSGAAYVFVRDDGAWIQEMKLTAPDGEEHDSFGYDVSISCDTAVIGASGDATWGSAHVFARALGTWSHQATLTASDRAFGDQFGRSVSISGDTVAVGAEGNDDYGDLSGSAYVFERDGAAWMQRSKFLASDGERNDGLGRHVALSGGNVVAGAWRDGELGSRHGAAYVFRAVDECPADIDDDGAVGFGELVAILTAWGDGAGPVDVDDDGVVGFGDVLVVLAAWGPCD